MWLNSILESLASTGRLPTTRRPRAASRKQRFAGLKLEPLESRRLLSFTPAVSYPISSSPQAVATGDFNGDGKADLVSANTANDSVSVLLNNGNGTFGAAQNYAVGTAPASVAVGDFNGDGKLDLVTTNEGSYPDFAGSVSVLLGNGDGTFQAPQSFAAGVNPESIAVGDFNRDGKLDLATANNGSYYLSGSVGVLLGNGDGTFQSAKQLALPPGNLGASQNPLALVAGDLNNDGKLDLAMTAFDNPGPYASNDFYLDVILGNGDGTFAAAQSTRDGVYSVASPVLGDFNGDGKPDVAVLDNGNIQLFSGKGDGSFQAPVLVTNNAFFNTMAVGDFNRDGKPDLAADGAMLMGNGDGTFQPGVADNVGSSTSLAIGDFNGDHFADIAAAHATSNAVAVSLNAADWQSSRFSVSGFPSPTTAGVAHSFTVKILDSSGNVAAGYTGTVHFTSSDPQAALPVNYTFTAADAGVHTFSATLKTAGAQSISVRDTVQGSVAGAESAIAVNASAASKIVISAPASVKAGVQFSLTITVEDAYGNMVTGYVGTIHFKSSDKYALLPADYTFTASDQGVHTFTGLVLKKKGYDNVTVSDTHNTSLTGSVTEYVQ